MTAATTKTKHNLDVPDKKVKTVEINMTKKTGNGKQKLSGRNDEMA